ncbi:MAG: CO dehydrogenase/acetyl-CoA synthase subunit delta [Candidatus Hermodarchaeota archaeon]
MTSKDKSEAEDFLKQLQKADIVELHNVTIEGDQIEISLVPKLLEQLAPMLAPMITQVTPPSAFPSELESLTFQVSPAEYSGTIMEVPLGATRADGGTREQVLTLGGHKTLPFHSSETPKPLVTFDVFDIKPSLPKPIKRMFEDVIESPGEWARKAVKDYKADAITIHLISTDPYIKDTPAKEAVKTVEEVLQAVKVPLVIGGSGNTEKDPDVLAKCAEVAEGERCLLASANLNFGDKGNLKIIEAAKKYNHNVLSWTSLDINDQKKLNAFLLNNGIERDRLIQDPTTASLGYGYEYSFSIYERIKIAGLKGDRLLDFPCSAGVTNAWGAREAHRSEKKEPQWGPRDLRGVLWEATAAFILSLVGADLFMMLHPTSVSLFKEMVQQMYQSEEAKTFPYADWVTQEF